MRELSVLAAAEEAPGRDCIVHGETLLSYAEVADRVRAAISALRDGEIAGGERVAITAAVDLDSIIWLYALFELGCPAVLLHPRLTDREQRQVLEQSRPTRVISEHAPIGPASLEPESLEPVPADRALAIVQTSGTGGAPRGAVLSRRAFVASAAAHSANLPWVEGDRWLISMPPAHVGGLSILTRCLIARRSVVLDPGAFDPSTTIRAIDEQHVTLLSVVPTTLQRLMDHRNSSWTPPPTLRAVLLGGAPISKALREEAARRGIPVLSTYGCTEACSQIATQSLEQSGQPGSGRPLDGIEVRLESDEIQVRGDVLMDGYLDEEPNDDPRTPDGWLRTGDLGRFRPDGQLEVLGRVDDLIITGGENVSPAEVEEFLCTVPGVTEACVFGLAHHEWGEEVVAALVTEAEEFDRAVLRARLRSGLAPQKRPKRVSMLDALPLNRSGKVDRAQTSARSQRALEPI
jgi:O-succinylbenzoic acid--CoA ligase